MKNKYLQLPCTTPQKRAHNAAMRKRETWMGKMEKASGHQGFMPRGFSEPGKGFRGSMQGGFITDHRLLTNPKRRARRMARAVKGWLQ